MSRHCHVTATSRYKKSNFTWLIRRATPTDTRHPSTCACKIGRGDALRWITVAHPALQIYNNCSKGWLEVEEEEAVAGVVEAPAEVTAEAEAEASGGVALP